MLQRVDAIADAEAYKAESRQVDRQLKEFGKTGEAAKGERLLHHILEKDQELFGKTSFNYTNHLNSLAVLHLMQGHTTRAESLGLATLDSLRRIHPTSEAEKRMKTQQEIALLTNLANVAAMTGDPSLANKLKSEAKRIAPVIAQPAASEPDDAVKNYVQLLREKLKKRKKRSLEEELEKAKQEVQESQSRSRN